jgi:hypothetical protein
VCCCYAVPAVQICGEAPEAETGGELTGVGHSRQSQQSRETFARTTANVIGACTYGREFLAYDILPPTSCLLPPASRLTHQPLWLPQDCISLLPTHCLILSNDEASESRIFIHVITIGNGFDILDTSTLSANPEYFLSALNSLNSSHSERYPPEDHENDD